MINAVMDTGTRDADVVDHKFVRQALKWLRGTEDEGALKAILDDLGSYLESHFEAEDGPGGLFELMAGKAPRYGSAVDDLRRDHPRLLAEVRRTAAPLKDKPTRATADTLAAVLELVEAIEVHEAREEALLQGTYERDFGGGE